LPAVIAALELIHDADPAKPSAAEHAAAGVLERAIDGNTMRTTVTAIEGVPLSWPDLRSAVLDAEKAEDNAIVAAALARRIETSAPGEADDARKRLRELSQTVGPARQIAKDALVLAGDDSVVKLLEEDAASKITARRISAALAFTKLRRYGRALQLLADDDVRVRAATACALLNADD